MCSSDLLSQTPACHKPTIVKSDNAREYHTQQLREVLKKHNVAEQLHSNEHQQFQNRRAEKLVDSIGRKIRGMLLNRCHQNSGVWQCCSPLTYTTARLIVVLAWNHLIITDITSSPTTLCSVLSDVPPLCIEAGTLWSTPNWHHGESWACTWVSVPGTVVVPL